MDEKDINILITIRMELVKHMNAEVVLQHMSPPTVFTKRDTKEIKAKKTREQQCNALLNMLPRGGDKAFSSFMTALERVQPHLAILWFKAGK